jgi:hypothetical protein
MVHDLAKAFPPTLPNYLISKCADRPIRGSTEAIVRLKCLIGLAVVTSVFCLVDSAHAQQLAATFDQLRVLVKPGDTLTITDTAGRKVQGRLSEVTPSTLALNVAGRPQQFQHADVDMGEKRGPDSLKNGALTGLAVGGGLAALFVGAALSAGEEGGYWYLIALPAYSGMGASIGAGVDALIEGRRVIYARSNSATAKMNVMPIVARGRTGVMVSMGF